MTLSSRHDLTMVQADIGNGNRYPVYQRLEKKDKQMKEERKTQDLVTDCSVILLTESLFIMASALLCKETNSIYCINRKPVGYLSLL